MATPAPLIRTPRPYSVGDDFALWIRRFEAYTRAVRIPDDKLSDALLALLDDAAFRAFDLLGLPEETVKDYKQLVDALKEKRFAPGAGQQELRFLLGQRLQEAGETLDGFADALISPIARTLQWSLSYEWNWPGTDLWLEYRKSTYRKPF